MAYIADLDPNNTATATRVAASEAEAEFLAAYGDPHIDTEDRVLVSEDDMVLVTQQDRDDFHAVLAWEEYHI